LRVIVTGGGTGGHIYPAMAVAGGLLARHSDIEVLYVGTKDGMEAKIVPDNGLEFKGISGKGMPRKLSMETMRTAGANVMALWETKQILKKFKPDLVVGTGGYVSGPVVLTSALFGIPTLLHEQNALPGKTNKFLAKLVKNIMLAFPESAQYFPAKGKIKVVGLPVREEIGRIERKTGAAEFGLNPVRKTLLVTGGSRGALSINKAMVYVLSKLIEHTDIQVIWGTGTATYNIIIDELDRSRVDWHCDQWKIMEYIKNMPEALACSDLCICRAGATTLAELSAAGKAGILIPYPYAAENHQEYNARAFANKQAAQVILDKDLNGLLLWEAIQRILFNTFVLEEMSARSKQIFNPGALDRIVNLCLHTAWR